VKYVYMLGQDVIVLPAQTETPVALIASSPCLTGVGPRHLGPLVGECCIIGRNSDCVSHMDGAEVLL
jgi:hypothetical protein